MIAVRIQLEDSDAVLFPGLSASVGIRKKGFLGSLDEVRPSLKIKFDHFREQEPIPGLDRLLRQRVQDVNLDTFDRLEAGGIELRGSLDDLSPELEEHLLAVVREGLADQWYVGPIARGSRAPRSPSRGRNYPICLQPFVLRPVCVPSNPGARPRHTLFPHA